VALIGLFARFCWDGAGLRDRRLPGNSGVVHHQHDCGFFGAYLRTLQRAAGESLANAPVDLTTSVVGFERVFEVVDLPLESAGNPMRSSAKLRAAI